VHEALYYEPHERGVVCRLCPKECVIGEGRSGFCRARRNAGGRLFAANYGACSSYALDPIEKKPLYHFYPGSSIFSVGTWGCNFACRFCQNWQIAQDEPDTVAMTPEQAVAAAAGAGRGNIGIAFTYSEPSVWYEFVLDTARLARSAGLKNALVTNGFINPRPLAELLSFIDALNIDVKAFNDKFYREICAGSLAEVKRTVELAAAATHVEVTCLVVPGLNDDAAELEALAAWLAGISKDIPLHFSRYFPNYKLDAPPTPIATLERAYETARRHLHYVYVGNVGTAGVNTPCPECGLVVIDRLRRESRLAADKKCPRCGSGIAVVGELSF
jgi:pyruvate formate lyase activating enzyme